MLCKKCSSSNVSVTASTVVKSKRRSFLWNFMWIILTVGIWIIWMLVRARKEKIVTVRTCICNDCGHAWTA